MESDDVACTWIELPFTTKNALHSQMALAAWLVAVDQLIPGHCCAIWATRESPSYAFTKKLFVHNCHLQDCLLQMPPEFCMQYWLKQMVEGKP